MPRVRRKVRRRHPHRRRLSSRRSLAHRHGRQVYETRSIWSSQNRRLLPQAVRRSTDAENSMPEPSSGVARRPVVAVAPPLAACRVSLNTNVRGSGRARQASRGYRQPPAVVDAPRRTSSAASPRRPECDETLVRPARSAKPSVVSCIKRGLSALVAERLASTTNLVENLLG